MKSLNFDNLSISSLLFFKLEVFYRIFVAVTIAAEVKVVLVAVGVGVLWWWRGCL